MEGWACEQHHRTLHGGNAHAACCVQPREQRQSVVKPELVSLVPSDMVSGRPEAER